MTLGVRIIAQNRAQQILLVRHTYVPGWHLPGGGVERGQTALGAVCNELEEEANVISFEKVRLLGVFFNRQASPRDHVLLYHCINAQQSHPMQANREIAQAAFFDRHALPSDTGPATLRRVQEFFDGTEMSEYW